MLQSLKSLPKFWGWIAVWTLINTLLFLPMRLVSNLLFSSLDFDFDLLLPGDPNLLMTLFDHLSNHRELFSGFIRLGIVGSILGVLISLGLVPAMVKALHSRSDNQWTRTHQILSDWPSFILPAIWRTLIWFCLTAMLMVATAMALLGPDTIKLTLIVLLVEWFIMLSWLTHCLVILGENQRAALLMGFVRLFSKLPFGILAVFYWLAICALVVFLQGLVTDWTLQQASPMLLSQLLFFLILILLHMGKFLWIAAHASAGESLAPTTSEPGLQTLHSEPEISEIQETAPASPIGEPEHPRTDLPVSEVPVSEVPVSEVPLSEVPPEVAPFTDEPDVPPVRR